LQGFFIFIDNQCICIICIESILLLEYLMVGHWYIIKIKGVPKLSPVVYRMKSPLMKIEICVGCIYFYPYEIHYIPCLVLCTTAILFSCIRKKFASKIDQTLKNTNASNSLSHLELAMVDVAICQENYDVAARYLNRTKNKVLCDYCNTTYSLQVYYYKDTVHIVHLSLCFINFILQWCMSASNAEWYNNI